MTNPKKKGGQAKSNVNTDCSDSTKPVNGDIRAAIIMANGVLDNSSCMVQQVYESCKMDLDKSAMMTASLHAEIANTERSNQSLTEEVDEL